LQLIHAYIFLFQIKQTESMKTSLEQQTKEQNNKLLKTEKEMEKIKVERAKFENCFIVSYDLNNLMNIID